MYFEYFANLRGSGAKMDVAKFSEKIFAQPLVFLVF
jgi:hypothetical protein